jgi:hypothetical protein
MTKPNFALKPKVMGVWLCLGFGEVACNSYEIACRGRGERHLFCMGKRPTFGVQGFIEKNWH